MKKSFTYLLSFSAIIGFFCLESAIVFAKPPPWAPAHGYRNKPNKKGDYERDRFGIGEGRCYRQSAGQYLGQVLTDRASVHISSDHGRLLASISGIFIGDELDRRLGYVMDDVDYFCTGQALELAKDNQTIRWDGHNAQSGYGIRPLNQYRRNDRLCRDFVTEFDDRGKKKKKKSTACRQDNGTWLLR